MNLQLLSTPTFWLLVMAGIAFVVLLWWTLLGAGRRSRRRALHQRIAELGQAGSESALAALSSMRHSITDAAQALLRPAGKPTGRAQLYRVPWLLFIGDAAANVPALLAAAHEASAVPAPAARESMSNTFWRWWFLGRMTAIETHADAVCEVGATRERALWYQALLALVDQRERLPLNGIVVCIDASTLHGQPHDIDETATHLRRLVDEACESLRLRLPVYIVVNGLDQLRGHEAVIDALPAQVLSQALGHRVSRKEIAGMPGEQFDRVFATIVDRLQALRMALARRQPAAGDRLAVQRFVEDVAALGPGLRRVAERLFGGLAQPDGATQRWRGLYFVATEEAASGVFVADLFQRLLPGDQPLAQSTD